MKGLRTRFNQKPDMEDYRPHKSNNKMQCMKPNTFHKIISAPLNGVYDYYGIHAGKMHIQEERKKCLLPKYCVVLQTTV